MTIVARLGIAAAGITVYGAGVYAAYWYMQDRNGAGTGGAESALPSEDERRQIFERLAPTFDSEIEWHEIITGIRRYRKELLRRATGRVLETAVGTGRNFAYYPTGCAVTAVDFSPAMLEVARSKASSGQAPSPLTLAHVDSQQLPFADSSFDTVLDTFGVCSFEDPVGALRELRRVVTPGGHVLLLEHGRSYYKWISDVLDSRLARHVQRFGCYWNRDIEAVVRSAGLHVEQVERKQLGTVYMIVARKDAS